MKQKSRKIFTFVVFKGLSFLLIAFIFICAFSEAVILSGNSLLEKKYLGNKAKVQGIVELWVISSFESGTTSIKSFLETVSLEFENQNKGAYILISSMTADEYIMRVKEGKKPDIISFSGDMGKDIYQSLTELEELSNFNEIIVNSARLSGGELIAYPWALGGYVLVSTSNRLEKASMFDVSANFSNCMSLGYEVKLKKSTRTIYSLCFGTLNRNLALTALETEAKVRGVSMNKNNLSLHKDVGELTGFGAYSKFIGGESVFLLGTQRDLARISMREKTGRESGFVVDYISYYSDIVQYVGVMSNGDEDKKALSQAFAKYLINESTQMKLSKLGMFPVVNLENYIYEDNYFLGMEKSLKHLDTIPNIFV